MYDLEPSRDDFLPELLLESLADYTGKINREIAVYINRKGRISNISIGDCSTVTLSEVDGRRSKTRLSGVRCIHTHPGGDGMLSAVDINSMLALRLDAMVAVGVKEGHVTQIYAALPSADGGEGRENVEIFGPFEKQSLNFLFGLIQERDKADSGITENEDASCEKAILVGMEAASLDELEELSLTAGLEVVEKVLQKRPVKDATFLIGRGKIEQLGLMRQALDADTLVFDEELSGAQIRNIENATGAKVVDRATLILDIFAQHATSSEGKIQVELAQLRYRLPRLMGLGGKLSRLGGGIGTRGPGEKKLEVDRRHIRKRISFLDKELENLSKRRGLMREGRKQSSSPVIALVGYTNSGKSTIMNKLCNSDVYVEDKLFATLDTSIRKMALPDGRSALLVDTVGFIRKLPHELVEAFKSTLEEAVFADALLHVTDASDIEAEEHIPVVKAILNSLGAGAKPTLMIMNKMDKVGKQEVKKPYPMLAGEVFEVSAVTGEGLAELLAGICRIIPSDEIKVNVFAPYDAGWVASYIHENGKVIDEEYLEDGIKIYALIKRIKAEKIREFVK